MPPPLCCWQLFEGADEHLACAWPRSIVEKDVALQPGIDL